LYCTRIVRTKSVLRLRSLWNTQTTMNEPGDNPPRLNYKWPWFVLAAFLAAVVLAVIWMSFAVQRERQQRDFNAPLPSAAPR